MRRFLLAAIVALLTGAAVVPAHAIIITGLSTEASLNGGDFSSHPSITMWPGSGSLEFIGLTNATVDTEGAFSLGTFNVNGSYGATSKTGDPADPLRPRFTIKVIHSSPLPGGSDTISGRLSGSFANKPAETWSTLTVTFTDSVAALPGFVYTVHAMTAPLYLSPQSVNASVVVTPEPSTLLLVGTALGLTGLAGLVRRKTR